MKSSPSNDRQSGASGRRWLKVTLILTVLSLPFVGVTRSSADQGRAAVTLSAASAALTQTSDTTWTLSKTGAVNAASSTVTWTVAAAEGATRSGLLIVNGVMTVTNSGAGGATIGNIVVNLQTRGGNRWVTRSSVVADATHDAAATAHIHAQASSEGLSTFTENTASGRLLFTDAATNSAFALVPQVTIAPGAAVSLRFSATFDNNVLGLPIGAAARAEVIVTFGNSGPSGASSQNIDINGNGLIDADEDWVRSVPARFGLTVPAQQPSNSMVTLTDTVQDITTMGTVTFSNPVISLGPTGGMVTVAYDGGASGGTITNCAHLTGTGQTVTTGGFTFPNVAGVNLTACDTQVIGPHTCSPGTPGCGWEDGDMVTYNQDSWGTLGTTASNLLVNSFFSVYPNGVEIGIVGAGGNSAIFNTPEAILDYQPTSGTPDPLDNDLQDPMSTSSGSFGGNVLALQLDVDFSDANKLSGSAGLKFGDLRVCGLTATPTLNNLTVRQVLAFLNQALGDEVGTYDYEALSILAQDLTQSFESGSPSLFAQQRLFSTPCP